jgi:hypothetical protein
VNSVTVSPPKGGDSLASLSYIENDYHVSHLISGTDLCRTVESVIVAFSLVV